MAHEIRVLTSDAELEQAASIFYTAMVAWPAPPAEDSIDFYEPGRCLGAFAGPELVGTATSFASWLTVPGGRRVPHAGVTDVGVLPSHTRQGVARELLVQQLHDIAARGEVVATLRASEGLIYERYGYGVASLRSSVHVRTRRAAFRAPVRSGGPVRLVEAKSSWEMLSKIYEEVDFVGSIERPARWWRAMERHFGRQSGAQYVVVHGEPGAEDGFARYQPVGTDTWFSGGDRAISVIDFVARTETAYLGLLRFLFGLDLIDRVELQGVPVDHSLNLLLSDPRGAQTTAVEDETWLRLVDVEAALAARTYRPGPVVTIAVTDDLLPRNTGSYRVGPDGAGRTTGAPDLTVDVATLGSVYLGGTRWWELARAGRVTEHRPGAVDDADGLFLTARSPFSGTMF